MSIEPTPTFVKQLKRLLKKYPSLKGELAILGDLLEENPFHGTHIGQDCYKIRLAIASKGRGKSGGGRVITCVKIIRDTVFLVSIYDKSERENLTESQLSILLRDAGLTDE